MDLSSCSLKCGGESFLQESVFAYSEVERIEFPSSMRVIGERALSDCRRLRSVTFGDNPMIEEIGPQAFCSSGLESFVAPPSLKRIDGMAFGNCILLEKFKLNEGIEKLDWLCFWMTGIQNLAIPPQVKMTPE